MVPMETLATGDSMPVTGGSKSLEKTPDVGDLKSSLISFKGSARDHLADYIHPVSGTPLFQRQPIQCLDHSDGARDPL